MRRFLIGLSISFVFITMAAVAQSAVQRVELIPPPAFSVPQGRPTVITLHFHVLPGFHINSDKPLSELLLATNLKLDPPGDIALGHIRFPEGKLMSFPFAQEEKLSVYSGDFEVKVTVFTTRGTKPGPYRTRGTLQYQACNDRQCFAPKSLPFTFDVKVLRSRN